MLLDNLVSTNEISAIPIIITTFLCEIVRFLKRSNLEEFPSLPPCVAKFTQLSSFRSSLLFDLKLNRKQSKQSLKSVQMGVLCWRCSARIQARDTTSKWTSSTTTYSFVFFCAPFVDSLALLPTKIWPKGFLFASSSSFVLLVATQNNATLLPTGKVARSSNLVVVDVPASDDLLLLITSSSLPSTSAASSRVST